MIEIENKIRITIDGEEVKLLKDICEVARIGMANHRKESICKVFGIDNTEKHGLLEKLMYKIFEA